MGLKFQLPSDARRLGFSRWWLLTLALVALILAWLIWSRPDNRLVFCGPASYVVFGNESELVVFVELETCVYGAEGYRRALAHQHYLARFDGRKWDGSELLTTPDPLVLRPRFATLFRHRDYFYSAMNTEIEQAVYKLTNPPLAFQKIAEPQPIIDELGLHSSQSLEERQALLDVITERSGWQLLCRRSQTSIDTGDAAREEARFIWNGDKYRIVGWVRDRKATLSVDPNDHERIPITVLCDFDVLGISMDEYRNR